ncbi:hypothetical protein B4100_2227 [Heyndrickxia coagulans]|nr:hypothetical protein B4100_2227 [Heyndrickxia coagulans]
MSGIPPLKAAGKDLAAHLWGNRAFSSISRFPNGRKKGVKFRLNLCFFAGKYVRLANIIQ